MGLRLSASAIMIWQDLEKRLRRLGERSRSTLIIVEGIYSMLGDQAPLAEIVRLKNTYNSTLLLDEAHSLGVLGETGQGLVEETGLIDEVDFITGTFSKSLGGIGGYCVSNHPQLDQLRYISRPYIFTASPTPATIASTRAALKLLREGVELRRQLWRTRAALFAAFRARLSARPGAQPDYRNHTGYPQEAIALWKGLLERGIYVNLMLPPAAPEGKSLVRCSVSAVIVTSRWIILVKLLRSCVKLFSNKKRPNMLLQLRAIDGPIRKLRNIRILTLVQLLTQGFAN